MTYLDAIKSGKPFRRKGWDEWSKPLHYKATVTERVDNLLAEDWEIKREPREFWVARYSDGYRIFSEGGPVPGDAFKVREVFE